MATRAVDTFDYRPSYLAAAITGACVLVLYVITLAPTTAMWDTSEYMAAAYTFGIPHPPGNPFFVILGRTFAILPIAPTVAQRLNLLTALASAVSAALWFLVTERVLVSWFAHRWQRVAVGAAAAVIGATAFTVWNQSVVSEKVYTIALLGLALVSWLTVRWCDDPDGPAADRILLLVAYLLGLGYANHMAGMLSAPAVAAAVLIRRPRTLLRGRLLLLAAGALLLGASPFAMQPLRASHYPAINMGEPTGCLRGLEASCLFSAETKDRFLTHFNRAQYGKPSVLTRQAPFADQIGMWWLYFKWQWLRDPGMNNARLQTLLATGFLLLGLAGGYVHWRRDRMSFAYFGPLVFLVTLGLIYYLNFKLGWTQGELMGIRDYALREVRDRDYFYLWSFSTWGVWAALGIAALWHGLATLVAGRAVRGGSAAGSVEGKRATDPRRATRRRAADVVAMPPRHAWLMAAPVLGIALIPLVANWRAASRAGETFTREWAVDMLNSVEPYGILITHGDNDTYPLWYAQEVEGVRKDVIVAVTSLLNTDWYVRGIIRRPVFEYDAASGPALYRDTRWQKPAGPPLRMSLEQADSIPEMIELRQPQLFRKGGITATIPAGYLSRDQLIVLRFILDAFPERPLYFSPGPYAQRLGLERYIALHGLVQRLLPEEPATSADMPRVDGLGWLDVQRSHALWDRVYRAPDAAIASGEWVDRASNDIPSQYVWTGAMLAEALARSGKTREAKEITDTAYRVARATGLDGMFTESGR